MSALSSTRRSSDWREIHLKWFLWLNSEHIYSCKSSRQSIDVWKRTNKGDNAFRSRKDLDGDIAAEQSSGEYNGDCVWEDNRHVHCVLIALYMRQRHWKKIRRENLNANRRRIEECQQMCKSFFFFESSLVDQKNDVRLVLGEVKIDQQRKIHWKYWKSDTNGAKTKIKTKTKTIKQFNDCNSDGWQIKWHFVVTIFFKTYYFDVSYHLNHRKQ